MSNPSSAVRRVRWFAVPVTGTLLLLLVGGLDAAAWISPLVGFGSRAVLWVGLFGWMVCRLPAVSQPLRVPAISILGLLFVTAMVDLSVDTAPGGWLHAALIGSWLGMAAITIELMVSASAASCDARVAEEARRIAHQLNNAMMPVVAQTQLLQMADMSPAEQDQALKLILKSAARTADWVKQLQQLYEPTAPGRSD